MSTDPGKKDFASSLSSAPGSVKAGSEPAPGLGGPLPGPGVVLAAVSGGADSVALLRLLHQAAPGRGWRLSVAHVDHGLRPDSEDDAAFVAGLAAEMGLSFHLRRVRVQARGRSLEEAAREARRAALLNMAAEAGAGTIALGHTADDQAETVLARLLCGTGPSGLAAMRPWDAPWWRPLLGLRREALRRWLRALGQDWREDPSNQQMGPLRNRVRQRLLPLAQELVNPRAVEALSRLAALAADEEEMWEQWCQRAAGALMQREGTSLVLAAGGLAALPFPRQRRLLRFAAGQITGQGQHLLARHVEQLRELLAGPPGRSLSLPAGLRAWREQDGLRLDRGDPPPRLRLSLQGPATVSLPHLGKRLAVELCSTAEGRRGRGPQAWLPAQEVAWPLILRSPLPGERFHPLGAPGSKRLSRFLIDRKVPPWWRARTLVVADRKGLWWVGPWAVAERARLKGHEGAYLRLSFVDTPL
ncbi:MAG: tRNA lysidine(34) synthetase TilS [Desulfarculus sp.]|nr:MAG: tRNA lysidine(34) synthetase TilS [Desulfarculus sp.]